LHFKIFFYKFTVIHFTSLPAEAKPPEKCGLVVSTLMKVSEKQMYSKESLWLLCFAYSMATTLSLTYTCLRMFLASANIYICHLNPSQVKGNILKETHTFLVFFFLRPTPALSYHSTCWPLS
jgi:hypothetical protein